MTQSTFNPTPGVSTHNDARSVWNGNAADAQSRLVKLEPSVSSKGGSYTFQATDKVVYSTGSSSSSYTLTDSSDFTVGQVIEVAQGSSGLVTLVEGAGTTIKRSRFAILELGGEGSTVRLRKQSAGTWIASGDLKEEKPVAAFYFLEAGQADTGDYFEFSSNIAPEVQGGIVLGSDSVTIPIDGLYRVTWSVYIRNVSAGAGDPDYTGVLLTDKSDNSELGRLTVVRWSTDFTKYSSGQKVQVLRFAAGTVLGFRSIDSSNLGLVNDTDRLPISFEWISD